MEVKYVFKTEKELLDAYYVLKQLGFHFTTKALHYGNESIRKAGVATVEITPEKKVNVYAWPTIPEHAAAKSFNEFIHMAADIIDADSVALEGIVAAHEYAKDLPEQQAPVQEEKAPHAGDTVLTETGEYFLGFPAEGGTHYVKIDGLYPSEVVTGMHGFDLYGGIKAVYGKEDIYGENKPLLYGIGNEIEVTIDDLKEAYADLMGTTVNNIIVKDED